MNEITWKKEFVKHIKRQTGFSDIIAKQCAEASFSQMVEDEGENIKEWYDPIDQVDEEVYCMMLDA